MSTTDFLRDHAPRFVPDVRLFFPEVRQGGKVISHPFDITPSGAGDRLRARVQEIVARPSRVGWRPPSNRGGDDGWHKVRKDAHEAFAFITTSRQPDNRHRLALKFGIADVVADALFAPVHEGIDRIKEKVADVALLSRPAHVDFWAPRRRRS